MSSNFTNEDIVLVCPNDDDTNLVDQFAIAIGVLTLIGSIVTYFVQQNQERKDAKELAIKEEQELDRAQALERVRKQLSVLIGPMQRAYKTQGVIMAHYVMTSGHGFDHVPAVLKARGQAFWTSPFRDEFLQRFIEDPHSKEAVLYRNVVTRRLKPVYTRIRELILAHMADLADMPTQEEWLERWDEEDVKSPYNGSLNINVIFDSYTAQTYEFDDIIQSWQEGDFSRMQPTLRHPYAVSNDLIDLLYDNAKAKEAKYNKHVSVHKNEKQEALNKWLKSWLQANNLEEDENDQEQDTMSSKMRTHV